MIKGHDIVEYAKSITMTMMIFIMSAHNIHNDTFRALLSKRSGGEVELLDLIISGTYKVKRKKFFSINYFCCYSASLYPIQY